VDNGQGPGQGTATSPRLTLAAAADQLGCSQKTIRRWIKSGKLPATLEDGPYGAQYWLSTQDVQTAQQALSVVKVEARTDPQTLALAIAQALDQRDAGLRAELAAIREELAALRSALTAPPAAPLATLPSPDDQTAQRPWWRRWWPR
jgi:MerR family transcriptional regulator, copper efflux regulator